MSSVGIHACLYPFMQNAVRSVSRKIYNLIIYPYNSKLLSIAKQPRKMTAQGRQLSH
ncbi:MAG: hypothetical protein LZF86_100297 [Nitrospira sp.]|nr:MAG: hypothetical protein LZF86_100297 [Nitrospira sp.]